MMLTIDFVYKGVDYSARVLRRVSSITEDKPSETVVQYFVSAFTPDTLLHKAITYTALKQTQMLICLATVDDDVELIQIIRDAIRKACKKANVSVF